MGFLRQNTNPASIPEYTGLQIQTSSAAVPITIIWGANKTAPNAIWTGGFTAIQQSSSGGGGGGGKGGGGATGYNYFTGFIMAVCEGPIIEPGVIWLNNSINYFNEVGIDFATYGSTPQPPWPYLSTFGQQSLGYNGVFYFAAKFFALGSSPSLPQFSIEVRSHLFASAGLNGNDADPALVIQDFLTNAQYGVLFPAASIDATTLLGASGGSSYQAYCRASFLAMSPVLANQEAANSILARWLQLTNSAAVWSGGKLKFIPYGDSPLTLSGHSFTPNVTPIYNLADDDFVHEDGKDPLEVLRSDPYASYNWQRLQISQRYNANGTAYDTTPIDAWDQNAIELYGLRMAPDVTASEICDPFVAQISAQLILQRGLYIRNHYNFKLSFEYCLLEPMDLVTVTDTALGLTNVAIRIVSIEEDDSGILAVTAEEFPGGTATAVQYPVQSGGGGNPTNQSVIPARVNAPVLYEPPASLTGGVPQIMAAVSGGIAPVYLLAEDGSTGQHSTIQGSVGPVQTSGVTVAFSVYAQAGPGPRNALRLNLSNGVATIGADFDLVAVAVTPDTGINATILSVGGSWFLCQISGTMAAAGPAPVSILLENPVGTASYTGTSGDGIYIWGAAVSFGGTGPTFLKAFTNLTGATLTTSGIATPEGTSGLADPNWGGAFVWISTDGITYSQVGTVSAPARQGVLTAALPTYSGSNPDTTDTLSVSLIESGGTLSGTSALNAQNGVTLCLVDKELLSYQFANLVLPGPNTYNLKTLYRGLYGTTPAAHLNGVPFTRVDSAVFQFPLPPAYIGVPLSMKFQSFNIFGRAVEDLSECAVYTYTPSGSGSPLGPVTITLSRGTAMDFMLVSQTVTESDQWGLASDLTINAKIDLGFGSL